MNRRRFLGVAAVAPTVPAQIRAFRGRYTPTSYNGIQPTTPWPPRDVVLDRAYAPPPYLAQRPAAVRTDVGAQLFTDDFLVDHVEGLQRRAWQPEPHPGNPVLVGAEAWEQGGAMPYSDGVVYDPEDGLTKAWYCTGAGQTCLAVSEDGFTFRKEAYDVVPGTNIVSQLPRDSTSIHLDPEAPRAARFKMFRTPAAGVSGQVFLHTSPDGIHWSDAVAQTPASAAPLLVTDRNTAWWNPFRREWVLSLRSHNADGVGIGRFRRYWATPSLASFDWGADPPVPWAKADLMDLQHVHAGASQLPQLYNLDCAAYESVVLGLFSVMSSAGGNPAGRPKMNELFLGTSRDGFHWDRSLRDPFITVSDDPQAWNWGNVQSAGGCLVHAGSELRFYVSGRRSDLVGSMGAYTLRPDGFASWSGTGTLTTVPTVFAPHLTELRVNAQCQELAVEVLSVAGQPIPGLGAADCVPVHGDSLTHRVRWRNDASLWRVAGEPVRLRFWNHAGHVFSYRLTCPQRKECRR